MGEPLKFNYTRDNLDTATGNGLVDAYKAVLLAKIRAISPIGPTPVIPIPPLQPIPISTGTSEARGIQRTPVRLNTEDVEALEGMIVRGEIDLDT